MNLDEIAAITGHQVRYDYKQPDEPDVLPFPDAYVIAPATFNTINKMASGASDTLALGLLNEAMNLPVPTIAVPAPNEAPARPPAFIASVQSLRSWASSCSSIQTAIPCRLRTWGRRPLLFPVD